MDKATYFIKACQANLYQELPWVISVFSLIQEPPNEWMKDPYPYRLVRDQIGYSYVNPTNTAELVRIVDADVREPLYRAKEPLALKAGDVVNLKQDITSTYGNCLFNYVALVYAFGTKIDYVDPDKAVDMKPIYKEILKRFTNDVDDISQEEPDKIYVREYQRFAEGMFFFTGMTQLFVYAGSEKLLLGPPGAKELRNKLYAEYADTLHETSTAAAIDNALIAHDAEFLKGDPSEPFLNRKARETVRKKLYLTGGAETSLSDDTTVSKVVPSSLSEGLDVTRWPLYMDGLRAGSFFRGAETMLGGVSAKELLRATSNINIVMGDCGALLGEPVLITDKNWGRYSNFSFVDMQGHTTKFRDDKHVGEYLGKRLMIRSPMYCQQTAPDYCSVCVGERLSKTPEGVSVEALAFGSVFLKLSLKKMHANVLSVAKMDFRVAIT